MCHPPLEKIAKSIAQDGHHIYVVSGGATPRFAYTIGLSESFGGELILAGAVVYMLDEVTKIINDIAAQLKIRGYGGQREITGLGSFTLRKIDSSWPPDLMLGAFDYYKKQDVSAFQIVPDDAYRTIDIPDMSRPWDPVIEPAWRWLKEKWTYPVSVDSKGVTDLGTLYGGQIKEVMRWEEDEWELFSKPGPDIPEEELRVVPLGLLLAADSSLKPIVDLQIGRGLWRDTTSQWHSWQAGGAIDRKD